MTIQKCFSRGLTGIAGLATLGAVSYGTWAGVTWLRYGRPAAPTGSHESDALLDHFMSVYETVERHHIRVHAPASVALTAAKDSSLNDSAIVRAIFRARQIALGAESGTPGPRVGIIDETRALGWGVLAETPGREIVMGAVTQPWKGNVVFRAVAPESFAAFNEPAYVKIIWTLRADPIGPAECEVITETRVATTDAFARAKFRRYWAFVSPGVVLIRKLSLPLIRKEAERRYLAAGRMTMKVVPPEGGSSI